MVFVFFLSLASSEVIESADSQQDSLKISLRSQLHGHSDLKKFKLNHPIKISHKEIINHLVSLKYKGTFLGNKEERVFSWSEVKKMAPILVKAFAAVGSGKIIHVELKTKGGITSGDIFSFGRYLNWRFDSIHGETFFQRNDIRGWNVFAWKLIPKDGQLYFKSGADKRIHKNWIVANLKLSSAEPENMNKGGTKDILDAGSLNNKINPMLEEKLEHLKYFHEKNLITEEEYKARQKKVLDELL